MFDDFIMVDWSSAQEPTQSGSQDSVWVAGGTTADARIAVDNFQRRQEAYDFVRAALVGAAEAGRKVLLGFDFAYGYPTGFASAFAIPADPAGAWSAVWRHLHDLAFDPQLGHGDVDNALDKFAVADELNRRFTTSHGGLGPFWGREDWTLTNAVLSQLPQSVRTTAPFAEGQRAKRGPARRAICAARGIAPATYPCLKMTSPGFPLVFGSQSLGKLRITERAHGAQETWHVFGAGVVGGQVLAGIPYLWRLTNDPQLRSVSAVWPFTMGFGDPTTSLADGGVVHAEIFPNAVPYENALPRMPAAVRGLVEDAWQVWTLVDHARTLDLAGQLGAAFAAPTVPAASLAAVIREEGWILFS